MNDSNNPQQTLDLSALTADSVAAWLMTHPEFLNEHPDLMRHLTPPQLHQSADPVEDFQYFMVERLQQKQQELQQHYHHLLENSRANHSTQMQVQRAVLALMKARTLQSLLQVVTQDLMTLFNVDVIRLAMETPLAEQFDAQFGEMHYSGLAAIFPGAVNALLGEKRQSFALADASAGGLPDVAREVFAGCSGLIQSCLFLRLTLPESGRFALLGFGVRHKHHFTPAQGDELMQFLGEILAYKLEHALGELL